VRRHLIHLCIASLLALGMFIGFNLVVDPYRIWHALEFDGVNAAKPQLANHERIYKIVGLARRPANAVILGTSQSDIGLNPNHVALGKDAINLALFGQPYRETRMLFDWLSDRKEIKTFVIGLDFSAANVLLPYPDDFVVENFAHERRWQLVLSRSAFVDSVITIAKRKALRENTWSERGLRLWSDEYVKVLGGHRKFMRASEEQNLTQLYLPRPSCAFDLDATTGKLSPLEEIRAVYSRAHRERVALKLLISPSHARHWETIAAAGLWEKWEEWKQRLVQMNMEEAQRAGQQPFPLWDFSGYHSISSEAVPALGDTETIMRWYFDASHYRPEAGDLVLDRIFGLDSPERTVPSDFGILLTSSNIAAHLSGIRLARQHYRQTHPEDVADIEAMARKVVETRRCKSGIVRLS
jgi:hypothetical protein